MSLGIIILTEEGVVLAAESLGTLILHEQTEIKSKCPKCGHEEVPNMVCSKCSQVLGAVPSLSREVPATHTFYCQKLFRINNHAGLIVVGNPTIGEMKAQHCVYAFMNWMKENGKFEDFAEQMVTSWQDFCTQIGLAAKHRGRTELIFAGIKANDSLSPFAQTLVHTKDKIDAGPVSSYGIVAVGVHEILDKMFGGGGIREYPVKEFPLQDAVEFAEFLMKTQIGYDKYTSRIARVGGDIDIAIVHPNQGFAWVRQKDLQKIIESQTR